MNESGSSCWYISQLYSRNKTVSVVLKAFWVSFGVQLKNKWFILKKDQAFIQRLSGLLQVWVHILLLHLNCILLLFYANLHDIIVYEHCSK